MLNSKQIPKYPMYVVLIGQNINDCNGVVTRRICSKLESLTQRRRKKYTNTGRAGNANYSAFCVDLKRNELKASKGAQPACLGCLFRRTGKKYVKP